VSAVASTTGEHLSFHREYTDVYAKLADAFGEQRSGSTRWVTIGAGSTVLTFFAPYDDDERVEFDQRADDDQRARDEGDENRDYAEERYNAALLREE